MEKKAYPCIYAGKKQATFGAAVVAGGVVYASGMSGRLPSTGAVRSLDPGEQTVDALEKVKNVLETAGSSLEDIVRLNIYVKYTERDREKIENAWLDYFRKVAPGLIEEPPAVTWVGVSHLYYPDMLVEFEATATVK